MAEDKKNIFENITQEKYADARNNICTALYSKIAALLENKKVELATTMFNEASSINPKTGKPYPDRSKSYSVGNKIGSIAAKSETLRKAGARVGKGYRRALDKYDDEHKKD